MSEQTTPLTRDDMAMAGLSRGDARKGEMEVFDGETECAGCDAQMAQGQPIYWKCTMHMECDPYCTACARDLADGTRSMLDAMEADFQAGRLP